MYRCNVLKQRLIKTSVQTRIFWDKSVDMPVHWFKFCQKSLLDYIIQQSMDEKWNLPFPACFTVIAVWNNPTRQMYHSAKQKSVYFAVFLNHSAMV